MNKITLVRMLAGIVLFLSLADVRAQDPSVQDLTGLWKAHQWFGPYARGPLLIEKTPAGWTADFAGRALPVEARDSELRFSLPNNEGSFQGRLDRNRIAGQWISPPSRIHGFIYASPVTLTADGTNRWRGVVTPRDDTFTLFLMVQKQPDGTLAAFMRNPERNIGVFYDVSRLVRNGDAVQLMGKRMGRKDEQVLLEGSYDGENDLLSIAFPSRGGTYDFRREGDQSDFYPRGKNSATLLIPPAACTRRRLGHCDAGTGAHRSRSDREVRPDADRHADRIGAHAGDAWRAGRAARQAGPGGVFPRRASRPDARDALRRQEPGGDVHRRRHTARALPCSCRPRSTRR